MPDFVVMTAFKTRDEMSSTFKQMGIASNHFAKRAVNNFGKIENKALSLKRIIGGVLGAAAIQRGLSLLEQGAGNVAGEFLAFDDAITAASAKFGIFDRKAPAFEALGRTAREVGASTEFTSAQAAEGLRFLAKAGWQAGSAMKALPSFVDLATASELDFARAADIATDVMGAFRLQSDNAEENLRQLVRVNDVLSKAVNMSNIDMEDLFETIKFAGPIAKTAGVSLEQFSAMAAFIGGAGIKGSLGGTALRTMFLSLIAPTDSVKDKLAEFNTEIKSVKQIKDNRKALKALGIVLDETGKLSPIETMRMLNERLGKLSPSAKAAALSLIFGKRAVSGAAVSLDGASGALQKFEQDLNDAGGTSKRMAEFMRGSLTKRFEELKSAAIELGFKVIETFEDKIPGGIDAVVRAIRNFDLKPVIDSFNRGIDVAKEFLQILRDYKGVLIGVAAAFVAVKIGAFVTSIIELVAAAKAFAAIGGMSGIFAGLAGAAAPIIAVAAAVGGVTAAIVALYTHWDDLGRSITWLIEDIQEKFISLGETAKNIIRGIVNSVPLIGPALGALLPGDEAGPMTSKRVKQTKVTEDMLARRAHLEAREKMGRPGVTGDPTMQKLAETQASTKKILSDFQAIQARNRMQAQAPVAPAQNSKLTTPSKTEVEARQRAQFQGRLEIAGAPQGSTFTQKQKVAPPIRVDMLGAN